MKPKDTKCPGRPYGDRILVRWDQAEDVTPGGIVLPDCSKEKPLRGTIVAVGPGKRLESGERVPIDAKPGDTMFFARYSGQQVKIGGEELLVMKEDDILLIEE